MRYQKAIDTLITGSTLYDGYAGGITHRATDLRISGPMSWWRLLGLRQLRDSIASCSTLSFVAVGRRNCALGRHVVVAFNWIVHAAVCKSKYTTTTRF